MPSPAREGRRREPIHVDEWRQLDDLCHRQPLHVDTERALELPGASQRDLARIGAGEKEIADTTKAHLATGLLVQFTELLDGVLREGDVHRCRELRSDTAVGSARRAHPCRCIAVDDHDAVDAGPAQLQGDGEPDCAGAHHHHPGATAMRCGGRRVARGPAAHPYGVGATDCSCARGNPRIEASTSSTG